MNNLPAHSDGTASLGKCLELFRRILADRGNTPLAVLARDMKLPSSTMYRLVGALRDAGLVARKQRGRFSAALTLAELMEGISANEQIAAVSRPALARLAVDCHATAHLGVMENDMVTYLVKVSASDAVAEPFTQENAQLEAYCTGIGKVLLAWLPAAEQSLYLAGGPFVRLTDRTITEPARLASTLKAVRAEQWAKDDGEIAEQLYCLAVPLWTDMTPMRAAISLSFQKSTKTADDSFYISKLRLCAQAISGRLGRK